MKRRELQRNGFHCCKERSQKRPRNLCVQCLVNNSVSIPELESKNKHTCFLNSDSKESLVLCFESNASLPSSSALAIA